MTLRMRYAIQLDRTASQLLEHGCTALGSPLEIGEAHSYTDECARNDKLVQSLVRLAGFPTLNETLAQTCKHHGASAQSSPREHRCAYNYRYSNLLSHPVHAKISSSFKVPGTMVRDVIFHRRCYCFREAKRARVLDVLGEEVRK
jgi:hypothetical protein